jgi:hypothetical protein
VSIRVSREEEEEEEESERLGAFASTENDAERVGQIPPSGWRVRQLMGQTKAYAG